ncbi:MAG: FkbM family methyltransferase [Chitinophagales bacterium]
MKSIFFRYHALLRIRFSPVFLKTWLLFKRSARRKLIKQKNYYLDLIRQLRPGNHQMLDIGANEGFVTEVFLHADLSVTAVEPDPRNIMILQTRFGANKQFRLYPCMSGRLNGTGTIYLQKGGTSFSTANIKWKKLIESGQYHLHSVFEEQSEKVQSVTLDELINIHGLFSFIKIDVEGNEREVFEGLSKKVPLICFEANLPEFLQETIACAKKLHAIDPGSCFNYSSGFTMGSAEFLSIDSFIVLLQSVQLSNIDVICRMSNYLEFYNL